MEVLNFTEKQINQLKKLDIPNEVLNTESKIYLLNYKHQAKLLIKQFYVDKGQSMASKLYNISLLGDNKENIGIKELVIPKYLVAIKKHVCAIGVPYIEGDNLGIVFNDLKIDIEQKINYLYQIGKLLKKTETIKIGDLSFSFGDLHEYNFIVNNNNIYAVDLDSCYLQNGSPQGSYYLSTNKNIKYFPKKYPCNTEGLCYPNLDSDLLCYNMIILNTLSRDSVSSYDMTNYFEYVNYLKELGFGSDLIKSFQDVYSSAHNINPYQCLDQIPLDKIGEANVKVYKCKKLKKQR